MSSYQYSTQNGIQTAAAPQKLSQYCDFVTFLGIAQSLSIDFLPITWQEALGNIGKGATAEIHEALLDFNTSFAFKRRLFKESFNSDELTGEILPSVVTELSILLAPSIRRCPNIMGVVGICWEIHSGDEYAPSRERSVDFSNIAVVPVLVFEKSKHGDLHGFMTDGIGKTLGFVERLEFCLEIARAIATMHSENVVHGDIKPQNVLVFQTSTKIYTVKVADFGYSTVHATDKDLIQMPRSLHWTAPEWHHRGFSFEQAKKMDVYSLGLLVLWLLCYNNPVSAAPQYHITIPATMESAVTLAAASLGAIQSDHGAALMEFFRASLIQNAADRSSKAEHLQEILSGERNSGPVGIAIPLDGEYPEGISKEWISQQDYLACTEQELVHSMHQLYLADYRVRIYIANCLIDEISSSRRGRASSIPSSDMYIQSALCYEIGFGVTRNRRKSCDIIKGRIASELQLANQLRCIREEGVKHAFASGILNWTERRGTVQFIDRIKSSGGKVGWERFRKEYRSEIMDASRALGRDNPIVLMLLDQLAGGFHAFGPLHEAETLQAGITEAKKRTLGPEHVETLASMAALADIYRRQIRLQEAQNLQTQIHEYFCERSLGAPCRDTNAESLALTFAKQGQWEESDELLEGIIRRRSASHGHEHPQTLRSRVSLAQSYKDRGQSKRAEELGTQVLEILQRTQGSQHPDTLRCLATITKTYQA
ncbi:MAG: hypothetical protein Q9170_001348 [Blastenia crenularia]